MEQKKFYKFTEHNEWENETWHFFLLLSHKEWTKIKQAIAKLDDDGDSPYELSDKPIPENEVDILVKHSDSGYLRQYNKVSNIKLPNEINLTEKNGDIFYKGGCWLGASSVSTGRVDLARARKTLDVFKVDKLRRAKGV